MAPAYREVLLIRGNRVNLPSESYLRFQLDKAGADYDIVAHDGWFFREYEITLRGERAYSIARSLWDAIKCC